MKRGTQVALAVGVIVLAVLQPARAARAWVAPATVDRIDIRGFVFTGGPGLTFSVLQRSTRYYLSDGRQWSANYTYQYFPDGWLDHVEATPDTIRYFIATGPNLWSETATYGDYALGPIMSSAGTLGGAGMLTLVAARGATTATMHGQALITGNDRLWNSVWGEPPFAYFSSIPGSTVPFELTYTLYGTTWDEHTFDSNFQYLQAGSIDFAHPLSVPALDAIEVRGAANVPDGLQVQYHAIARYENGSERDVTHLADWALDAGTSATQTGGAVTIPVLSSAAESLTLRASYAERGASRAGARSVQAGHALPLAPAGAWPQFQADARHTGYQPIVLDPRGAALLWSRTLDARYTLNPVVAADGLVFATLVTSFADTPQLFALRGATGEVLWSKSFGPVSSVNPPSWAYGNLYLQTGKPSGAHATAALHAFDARTGATAFRSIHGAQWSTYYAPAMGGRTAYVNGGHYGGMYAFDALSGERLWFKDNLPAYERWTPALDEQHAYAFLGTSFEGALYAVDRTTGALAYARADTGTSFRIEGSPTIGDLGELLIVNQGRLLCYDRASGTLRWKLPRSFAGRVSVAHGTVWAIDGGALVSLDEASGAERWRWQPPEGQLTGPLVVTDSHVLATTSANTYAIGVVSHASEWSYPFVGQLAVADGVLYVAGAKGVLRAIRMVDSPTATVIEDFRATRTSSGVALSWVLAGAADGERVRVERAPAAAGPWVGLELVSERRGARWTAEDPGADPGRTLWYRLVLDGNGSGSSASGLVEVPPAFAVAEPRLALASANPAASTLRLDMLLPRQARVRVFVTDLAGRTVANLVEGERPAGRSDLEWSPGPGQRAGLYMVSLDVEGVRRSVRVAFLR